MTERSKHGRIGEQGRLPLRGVASDSTKRTITQATLAYVSSGIATLDVAMAGGLPCGAMTLVASRAQVGSTSLMIGATLEALRKHQRVLYVTDRLKDEPLRGRLMVRQSEVNGYRFRAGVATDDDHAKLTRASEAIAWERLKLISRRSVSLGEVEESITSLCPNLIVADFEPGRSRDGRRPSFHTLKQGLEHLDALGRKAGAALAVRHVLPLGSCEPDQLELPGLGVMVESFDSVLLLHRDVDATSEQSSSDVDAKLIRLSGRDIRPRRVPLRFDQRFGGLLAGS